MNPQRPKSSSSRRRSGASAGSKLIFSEAIPSSTKAVEPVVARLLAALAACGSMDGQPAAAEVALREALINAVVHGNRGNSSKPVQLDCFLRRDQSILLVVGDQGKGFDPARIPDPTAPENILRSAGRGIFLIRHFMDEVEFRRGGSEIRMRKNR